MLLTEGEVTRRVRAPMDRALQDLDKSYLRDLAAVLECLGTVTPASVVLASSDAEELARVRRWIQTSFSDCSGEPILYLACTGSPSSLEIGEYQRLVSQACEIPMHRIARPIHLPSDKGWSTGNSISAQLKYESRGFSQVIIAMRNHIKVAAARHALRDGSCVGRSPTNRQVSDFLAEALFKDTRAEPKLEEPGLSEAQWTGVARESVPAAPVQHGLPPDIEQALSNRMALYRRRLAQQPADNSISAEIRMQSELRSALVQGDPLDAAAICCLMWDVGFKIATPTPSQTTAVAADTVIPAAGSGGPEPQSQPKKKEKQPPQAQGLGEVLLTTDELSVRIRYDARTIREKLVDTVLLEGTHYVRPFGGRKILFRWAKVAELLGISAEGADAQ